MINELFLMNGYGVYVWPAFVFVITSFISLYLIIKLEQIKEKRKFVTKFGSLSDKKIIFAKTQSINKEILSTTAKI